MEEQSGITSFTSSQEEFQLFQQFLLESSTSSLQIWNKLWVDTQQYKTITDKKLRQKKAKEIYDNYIQSAAQKRNGNNLSDDMKHKVKKNLKNAEPDLFDELQRSVFLVLQGTYEQFLQSELYKNFKEGKAFCDTCGYTYID